ncbi:MAG: type I-E CRISPR-associated protein Cas6/Cse3/CasE [Pseudomonadota bacterium]|nr:type I-E CRISPR-associated protein Cas6/Cse3/CasE [Pseudomonadota bacterium]
MSAEPFHLVGIDVYAQALVERAHRQGLPMHQVDPGYLLHSWLEAAFGPAALRPFVIERQVAGRVRVLAYSAFPVDDLRAHAQTYAAPDIHAAADWASLQGKAMPATWRVGQRLGFRTRVCPTIRVASEGAHAKKGSEVDAWIAACRKVPREAEVVREDVYRAWLGDALTRSEGADMECGRLDEFQLARVLRRTQGDVRTSKMVQRPEAVLDGTLVVKDPVAFATLLRRGVGRHRAFGFGMLLLMPPRP